MRDGRVTTDGEVSPSSLGARRTAPKSFIEIELVAETNVCFYAALGPSFRQLIKLFSTGGTAEQHLFPTTGSTYLRVKRVSNSHDRRRQPTRFLRSIRVPSDNSSSLLVILISPFSRCEEMTGRKGVKRKSETAMKTKTFIT